MRAPRIRILATILTAITAILLLSVSANALGGNGTGDGSAGNDGGTWMDTNNQGFRISITFLASALQE
jgi:hypothetical protein